MRVTYGMQGRSQIRNLYGEQAEVLLSAPFTKILVRTSEPEASEWLSKTVGDVEIERLRESSRPARRGNRGTHSYSTERVVQKLVLPSEFHGLDNLNGYIKYGNLALKMRLPIVPRRERADKFIPREGLPLTKKPLPSLKEIRARKAAEPHRKKGSPEAKALIEEIARAAAMRTANGTLSSPSSTEAERSGTIGTFE